MIANWLKALWILAGGAVAAAGAAYVTGVFDPAPDKPMVEAAVQQSPDQKVAAAKTDKPSGDNAMTAKDEANAEGSGEQMASLEPQDKAADAAAPDEAVIVPAFDLVRVEPNGSVVIAGTSAPGSSVEVISGATVIGTADTSANGDFAVVLDDPLKPGDYTIVLRSTGPGEIVATSAQTAIISVPDTEAGQVLALVEEPGAPSRLITVPTAKAPVATAKSDRPKAVEPAQEAVGPAKEEAIASADQPKPEPSPKPEMAAKPEMTAKAEPAAPKDEMPEAEKPVAAIAEEAPATAEEAPATMETAKADEPAGAAQKPAEEQMAAVEEPKPAAPEPMAKKPVAPKIAVEAVEIEGRKIFVAGFAEPGSTVRVYANDILLGQSGVSAAGRFLIEAEKDLPVGDYIVRADMLGKDKAEVLARAAVPFEREPGEKVAAVAAPAEPESAAKPDEMTAGEAAQKALETTPVPEAALQSGQTAEAEPAPKDAAPKAGDNAMAAAPTDKNEPPKPAAEMAMADPAPAKDMMADGAESAAAPADETASTGEILSPKLQNVGGAVIIRRGDTLWRLSRRVYGRGIRYTTIYLANENQISDPDMIWPGQVFSVPGETKEGESADMSAVAEQATKPEEVVTR